MSAPGDSLDASVRHLLDVVTRHRDEKCAELLASARAEAEEMVRAAWRKARARLHDEIIETRRRAYQTLASQEAQLQTRLRQQRQAEDVVLVAAARASLRAALLRRWQQPESRLQWSEAVVNTAAATLNGRGWTVLHPPGWPVSEQQELLGRVTSQCGTRPRLQADEDIQAGLRICAGDTCIDATLEGLLQDRDRIDAELLAQCTGHTGDDREEA